MKTGKVSASISDQQTNAGTDVEGVSKFLKRFCIDDYRSLNDLCVNLASDDEEDAETREKKLIPYHTRQYLKLKSKRIIRERIA